MSFGIVDVITLLLGLSGFGLQVNPKAPTADQSLQYAMPDADIVGHFDAASVIPGNYKALQQLADQAQIKASPDLAKMVRKAINEVEGARGLAKTMTGIDVTTDIDDMTVFLQIVPKHDPNVVVAVHGRFNAASVDKIATMAHKTSVKVGGATWVDTGDGNAVGVTKDGVLLAGSVTLVKDRVSDTWRSPSHVAGTSLGYIADVLSAKPVVAIALTLSPIARKEVLSNTSGQNFLTDVVKRHKLASFAIYHDGVGWSWIDSSKAGLDSMAQLSDGMIDLFRAGQIAPRGVAKIVLGALDSYKGTDKQIDELIRHKADVLKIIEAYSGDGTFKAQVDTDPKTLKLTVRLTGRTLSEVLPIGGLLPLAALGVWRDGHAAIAPPLAPMQIPAPVPVPTKKRP